MNLDELDRILARERKFDLPASENRSLQDSIDFLNSDEAVSALELDAYWPKWTNPWWHMLLLFEMGMSDLIPRDIADRLAYSLNRHCIKFFPLKEEELPSDIDPFRNIPCHCQLGCMYQVLHACGLDLDRDLPWIRPWFLRYQLPDGGLNCDESVYTRQTPRSSVVSSLPPLEAILRCTGRDFTSEERRFLDAGARYLIERQLCRSLSKGRIIDESWLQLCFPRFYHYDILRGLSFLLDWSLRFRERLPLMAVADAIAEIDRVSPDGCVSIARNIWEGANSRCLDLSSGIWIKGESGSFALLEDAGRLGQNSAALSRVWMDCLDSLRELRSLGLLTAV